MKKHRSGSLEKKDKRYKLTAGNSKHKKSFDSRTSAHLKMAMKQKYGNYA